MNNDERLFSLVALGLFLAALLVPFLIAIFARDELALGFGVVAAALALLFGILSWSERISKVVTLALGTLMGVAGVAILLMTIAMPLQIAQARAEEERAIAARRRAVAEAEYARREVVNREREAQP